MSQPVGDGAAPNTTVVTDLGGSKLPGARTLVSFQENMYVVLVTFCYFISCPYIRVTMYFYSRLAHDLDPLLFYTSNDS
jgi:hypothetical protein